MTEWEKGILRDLKDCVINTPFEVTDDIDSCYDKVVLAELQIIKREIKEAFDELPEEFIKNFKSSSHVALSEFIYGIYEERGIE